MARCVSGTCREKIGYGLTTQSTESVVTTGRTYIGTGYQR